MESFLPTKSSSFSSTFPTSHSLGLSIRDTQAYTTPAPTASCAPDVLVVQLSTTVVIYDFNEYYAPASIENFVPSYFTSPDGSLISTSFRQNLVDINVGLLVIGALAMVFARNIVVSADYIRRNKVKKKMLFYVLFLSQILAPVSLTPVILSYFNPHTPCFVVLVLSCVCGATSLALLITVILGVKAYKCLNNARFIPVVLGLFQLGSIAVVILDIIKTRVMQRWSGSCIRTDDLRFTRYFVILQLGESLFICFCFLYVCWKSRGSPAARGRISIELSMDDLPIEFPQDAVDKPATGRRGWWDYVAEEPAVAVLTEKADAPKVKGGKSSSKAKRMFKKMKGTSEKNTLAQNRNIPVQDYGARNSMAPSSFSGLSRLIPRMELFRQVMKDELLYTTFISFSSVIVAVLVIIGVNVKNGLSVAGWIALNWCIISLLAIHSFGRVVHRHEKEQLLAHPVTCTALARAANDIVNQRTLPRRAPSFPPTRKSFRIGRDSLDMSTSDPFADTRPLNRVSSLMMDYQDATSLVSVPRSEFILEVPKKRVEKPQNVPSSPHDQDFAPSNPTTPTVSIKYFNTAHRREFSRSWLVSSASQSLYSETHDDKGARASRESET